MDMPWIVSGIDWMLVFCAGKRVASGVIQDKFDGVLRRLLSSQCGVEQSGSSLGS